MLRLECRRNHTTRKVQQECGRDCETLPVVSGRRHSPAPVDRSPLEFPVESSGVDHDLGQL
jgi:hypothetical protein